MPFRSGIDKSITTTSGDSSRTIWTADRPSAASPATAMSGWLSTITRSPDRIIW